MDRVRTFATIEELVAAVGEDLGAGAWFDIDQSRVNTFADATDDHQWIHVDLERSADGPFGGSIAHGYLTLSLIPALGRSIFALAVDGPILNYGLNKVRFPSPVRAGQRVRARAAIASVTQVPAGHQLAVAYTVEIDGEDKPACVAETVVLLLD